MHNIIIIGSGPAGAATAITCALQNLDVTLIEAKPFPRVHPGETLHPGTEPLLQQLGVQEDILKANFIRHQGNWVKWEGENKFIPFGSDNKETWQGFQAVRADFDNILLKRAQALGVKVLQPCHAKRIITQKGKIIGVETSQGFLQATKVIDASGSNHWLAKELDIAINYHSPRLIAYYGYVQGECPERDEAPAIVADASGWTWTAKVKPQVYQWSRLTLNDEKLDPCWRPLEFENLQVYQKTRAADVTWRIVSQPAGYGYFMVGDAAMVLDPASSHGVLKALMSGIMAGHLIISEATGKITQQLAIQHYNQWINNWFNNDVEELTKLYRMLPSAPGWVNN
jgi:flavin-dependent dehydrogenase